MMMKIRTLWMVLSLAACARPTPVIGPDGTYGWYVLACGQDMGACYQQASEVCPKGYATAEGHDVGRLRIKCEGGFRRGRERAQILREERTVAPARVTAPDDQAALVAIQKHPKFPELGAQKPEANATCVHEQGEWVDQGAKVVCKIKGEPVFTCSVGADGTMTACTRYSLGRDLTDERDALAATNGKPSFVGAGESGFRTFTWDTSDRRIVLTGYPAGVMVTESRFVDEGAAH
jgi:hypothetical protein